MINQTKTCSICFSKFTKIRTILSLYAKQGDIVIKNYPLYVCHHCGQIDLAKADIKKTLQFLDQQKNKNGKVS